jgi:hypothetical protein
MAYISKEDVKQIRENLKKALPEYKFSVTGGNTSSVDVNIMAGVIDFGIDKSINPYHFEKHFEHNPPALEVLKKIMAAILGAKEQKESSYDSDYGSIPNFYYNVRIGKWNKEYMNTKAV